VYILMLFSDPFRFWFAFYSQFFAVHLMAS